MRYLSLIIFLMIIHFSGNLQGNVDSLRIQYRLAGNDTTRVRLLTEIGDKFQLNNPDSALWYYKQGLQVANESNIRELKIHEQKGLLLRYIGIQYRIEGEYYIALDYYRQALDLFTLHDIQSGISAVYNNYGVVYRNLGDYPRAIEYYHKALDIFESTGDTLGVAFCYNNIGIIHDIQKDYPKALEYFQRANKIFEEGNYQLHLGSTLMNIGNIYVSLEQYDQAMEYYQLSLDIFIPINNKASIARIYQNISIILSDQGRYPEALDYMEMAKALSSEMKDRKSLTAILRNQSDILRRQGKLAESHKMGLQSLEIAQQINALDDQTYAYHMLMNTAEDAGNISRAYEYSKKYIALNDSLHDLDKSGLIFDLEARYQNEKKQNEIELLNQAQELQRIQIEENLSQLQLRNLVILLAFLMLVAGLIFFIFQGKQIKKTRNAREQIKKINQDIQVKNKEIRIHRNEITSQRNVIFAQKTQIQDQKLALALGNKEKLWGLRFAERIQSSLAPAPTYLKEHFKESLILFKPKGIVSGDFYWISHKNGKLFIATADNTSRGVTGAMLSLMGMALLNETLNQPSLETSAQYLGYLTRRFEQSLLVSEEDRQTPEGMEISFCILDSAKAMLEYSGPDSSLAIIRDHKMVKINCKRKVMNRQSFQENEFASRQVKIHSGDMLYMFSDGFINQLGGSQGNRYTEPEFFRLLENISPHNSSYQISLLESELDSWKGNTYEQADDIMLLGFRI